MAERRSHNNINKYGIDDVVVDDYDYDDDDDMEVKREAFAIETSLNLRHLEQMLEKILKIEKQLIETMPSPNAGENRVSTTDYYSPSKDTECIRESKRARLS